MARKEPTPVRFDPDVMARLVSWVSAHPGLSLSSATNRLVDEALRADEHPGVVFRQGATGRRAGLIGGPDVWEVVRALRSARGAEPQLGEQEILQLVSRNTGMPVRLIQVAVRYWANYPDEIDAEIRSSELGELVRHRLQAVDHVQPPDQRLGLDRDDVLLANGGETVSSGKRS